VLSSVVTQTGLPADERLPAHDSGLAAKTQNRAMKERGRSASADWAS
jgi:hypothetical protein